jgi:hypothetical protein
MRTDPGNTDRKRKAYVAVAAKLARVTYALIRSGADYRCFHEVAVPSGRTYCPVPLRRFRPRRKCAGLPLGKDFVLSTVKAAEIQRTLCRYGGVPFLLSVEATWI